MCCFSRPVRIVSSTRIFARPLADGRQVLVYGMSLTLDEDLAMVLPIPVPPGSAEDAVWFVDLSTEPGFLDTIDRLFPAEVSRAKGPLAPAARQAQPRPKLAVQAVGDFEASFVPSQADFDRLDERFRLPAGVWERLPGYSDWGFCVFKLRKGRGVVAAMKSLFSSVSAMHPMAFEFPRRDPRTIFFPTVHVHDGEVHEEANFDHSLYCQIDPEWEPIFDWQRSEAKAPAFGRGAAGIAKEGAFVYRMRKHGMAPNRDIVVEEAKLLRRNAFGPSFRLRMSAAWEDVKNPRDPNVARWNRVTEEDRVRIKEQVSAELSALLAQKTEAFGLRPYRHDLPAAHPDFYEAFPTALPPNVREGCLVSFFASNDRIESQSLTVAFSRIPEKPVRAAIQSAFQAALDRATLD